MRAKTLCRFPFRSYTNSSQILDSTPYIDLRSDTVTRPGPRMREAMMSCQLGDDVFGDDITTHKMQEAYAKLFGKEAGLIFPSGT